MSGFDHAFKTYVGLPPNEFSFGGVVKDERAGTATLTVYVPRPGTLELAETRKVEGYEETAESPPGVEDLRVTPKGKAKQTLNEEGRVEVRAWVTYTPTNGTANTLSRMIKLVRG